eukprot:6185327-Pleurochrysis_carterae.AAC.2
MSITAALSRIRVCSFVRAACWGSCDRSGRQGSGLEDPRCARVSLLRRELRSRGAADETANLHQMNNFFSLVIMHFMLDLSTISFQADDAEWYSFTSCFVSWQEIG